MQKIFHFELGMAIKDRPKIFQVITLVLFAFSLTVILLGAAARLTTTNDDPSVLQNSQVDRYADVGSSLPAAAHLQK
jgi:hypothetical protein